jgi:ribosomal-protein-alanine N-acetyltransferase
VELRTDLPDCVLRPWAASDKPSLVRYANNKAVWRNLLDSFPHPYAEADAEFWIAHTEANPGLHFAIQVSGEAVGGIGVIPQSGLAIQTAQFGYWLGESFWGKGIATAAARTMASYAFTAFRFARLEAPVFAWNPASMRVLEKAGFSREGVLRHGVFKDGQLIDSVLYARLRVV